MPVNESLRPFQIAVDDPHRVLAVERDDLERPSNGPLACAEGPLDLDLVGLDQMNLPNLE